MMMVVIIRMHLTELNIFLFSSSQVRIMIMTIITLREGVRKRAARWPPIQSPAAVSEWNPDTLNV
jgi:hypothetical protein